MRSLILAALVAVGVDAAAPAISGGHFSLRSNVPGDSGVAVDVSIRTTYALGDTQKGDTIRVLLNQQDTAANIGATNLPEAPLWQAPPAGTLFVGSYDDGCDVAPLATFQKGAVTFSDAATEAYFQLTTTGKCSGGMHSWTIYNIINPTLDARYRPEAISFRYTQNKAGDPSTMANTAALEDFTYFGGTFARFVMPSRASNHASVVLIPGATHKFRIYGDSFRPNSMPHWKHYADSGNAKDCWKVAAGDIAGQLAYVSDEVAEGTITVPAEGVALRQMCVGGLATSVFHRLAIEYSTNTNTNYVKLEGAAGVKADGTSPLLRLLQDTDGSGDLEVPLGVKTSIYMRAPAEWDMADSMGLTRSAMPWFKIVLGMPPTDGVCTAEALPGTQVQVTHAGGIGNVLVATVTAATGCCNARTACIAQSAAGTWSALSLDDTNAFLLLLGSVPRSTYATGLALNRFVTIHGTGFPTTLANTKVTVSNTVSARAWAAATPSWVSPDGMSMVVSLGAADYFESAARMAGLTVKVETTVAADGTSFYEVDTAQIATALTGDFEWSAPMAFTVSKTRAIGELDANGIPLVAQEGPLDESLFTAAFYHYYGVTAAEHTPQVALIWFQLAAPAAAIVPGSTVSFHLHATGPFQWFGSSQKIYLQARTDNGYMACSGIPAQAGSPIVKSNVAQAYLPFPNYGGTPVDASASYAFTGGITVPKEFTGDVQVCLDYDGDLGTKDVVNFEDFRRAEVRRAAGKTDLLWADRLKSMAHVLPGTLAMKSTRTNASTANQWWVYTVAKPLPTNPVRDNLNVKVVAGQHIAFTIAGGTQTGLERIHISEGQCDQSANLLRDANGARVTLPVSVARDGGLGVDTTPRFQIPSTLSSTNVNYKLCYNPDGVNDDAYDLVTVTVTKPTWSLTAYAGAVAGNKAQLAVEGGTASGMEMLFIAKTDANCAKPSSLTPLWAVTETGNSRTAGAHMPSVAAGDYHVCYSADGADAYSIKSSAAASTTHTANSDTIKIKVPTWAVSSYGHKALIPGNRIKLEAKALSLDGVTYSAVSGLSGFVHIGTQDCTAANMVPGTSAAWSTHWAGSTAMTLPISMAPATYLVCHNGAGRTWVLNDKAYQIKTHQVNTDATKPQQSGTSANTDMQVRVPTWEILDSYTRQAERVRGSNLLGIKVTDGLRVNSVTTSVAGGARETVWFEKAGPSQQCVSQSRHETPKPLSSTANLNYDTADNLQIGVEEGSYVVCYDVQGRGIGAQGIPLFKLGGASLVVDDLWNPTWTVLQGKLIPSITGVSGACSGSKCVDNVNAEPDIAAKNVATTDDMAALFPSAENNSRVQFQLWKRENSVTVNELRLTKNVGGNVPAATTRGGNMYAEDVYAGPNHLQVVWQEVDANSCEGDDDSWIPEYLRTDAGWKNNCQNGVALGSTGTSWACQRVANVLEPLGAEPNKGWLHNPTSGDTSSLWRGYTNQNGIVDNTLGSTPAVSTTGPTRLAKYAYTGFVLGQTAGVYKLCYSPTGNTGSAFSYEIFQKDTKSKLITAWPTFRLISSTGGGIKALTAFSVSLVGGTGVASEARATGKPTAGADNQLQDKGSHIHIAQLGSKAAIGSTTDCQSADVYFEDDQLNADVALQKYYPMGAKSVASADTAGLSGVRCEPGGGATGQEACNQRLHFDASQTSRRSLTVKTPGTYTICYTPNAYVVDGAVSLGTFSVAPPATFNGNVAYSPALTWPSKLHYTYAKYSQPALADMDFKVDVAAAKSDLYLLAPPSGAVGSGEFSAGELDAVRLFNRKQDDGWCSVADATRSEDTGLAPALEYKTIATVAAWRWSARIDAAVGTYLMCFCDASRNDQGTGGLSNCALDDDKDFVFEQGPGFVHVVDALSVRYIPGSNQGLFFNHYTVMKGATPGTQRITIPFKSGLTAKDRFYFANAGSGTSRCGDNEDLNVGAFINTGFSTGETANEMVIPQSGFGKNAAGTADVTMNPSRSLICVCKTSGSSTFPAVTDCDASTTNYGAQVGVLHVVSNARFQHVTLAQTTGTQLVRLSYTVLPGQTSRATVIPNVRAFATGTSAGTDMFGFGTCGTFAAEMSPSFFDSSATSISMRPWDNWFSDGTLQTSIAGGGNASGKGRVCVCEVATEKFCDDYQIQNVDATKLGIKDAVSAAGVAEDAFRFGAFWGWMHRVNVDRTDLHVTVLKAQAGQKFAVKFLSVAAALQTPQAGAGSVSSADRFQLISSLATCGAAETESAKATLAEKAGVLTAAGMYTTYTGEITTAPAPGKNKVCYCNSQSESKAFSGFENDSCIPTSTGLMKFGPQVGFLHVVDAAAYAHVSIATGAAVLAKGGASISLTFGQAESTDRFYLVNSDAMCGDAESTASINSVSAVSAGSQFPGYAFSGGNTITLTGILANAAANQVPSNLKSKVCMCDYDVEFAGVANAACQGYMATPQMVGDKQVERRQLFGAHAAWLHLVDVDFIPAHATVAFGNTLASSAKIKLSFKSGLSTLDRMSLVAAAGLCGVNQSLGAPFNIENALPRIEQLSITSFTAEFALDTDINPTPNNLSEQTAGKKHRMCFCDADTDACGAMPGALTVVHTNEIGFLHVVDTQALGFHWTVTKTAGQALRIKFKGQDSVTSLDRLSVTRIGERCGDAGNKDSTSNAVFDDVNGAVLNAGTRVSTLTTTASKVPVSLAKENTLSVTIAEQPQAAGKLQVCFCDQSAENNSPAAVAACGSAAANFGAALGVMHVVDAPSVMEHFTLPVNGGAQTELTFKFTANAGLTETDADAGKPDRFWLIRQSDPAALTCGFAKAVDYSHSPGFWTSTAAGSVTPEYVSGPVKAAPAATPPTPGDNSIKFKVRADHHDVAQICFCDHSVEGACAVPFQDTASYGATLGFVHAVNVKSLSFHATIAQAANQNFALIFDDVTSGGQPNNVPVRIRLAGVGDGTCRLTFGAVGGITGSPEESDLQLVPASQPASAAADTHFPVVRPSTSAAVVFKLKDAAKLTGTAVSKVKICLCDSVQRDDTGATKPCENGNERPTMFSAEIGFLHVVPMAKANSHITLASNGATAATDVKVTVEFLSADNMLRNKFMFVKPERPCAYARVGEVDYSTTIMSSTLFADATAVQVAQEAPTNSKLITVNIKTVLNTGIHGKVRMCMCSFSAEGGTSDPSDPTCGKVDPANDPNRLKNFGSEVAWVHMVNIASVGQSFTIAKVAGQDVKITFSAGGPHEGEDKFMLVDGYSGECGLSKEDVTLWPSLTSKLSTTNIYALNPQKVADVIPAATGVGKATMCFCDRGAAVGTDDIEQDCGEKDSYWRFGARVGVLHVVDTINIVRHYTISRTFSQDQAFEIVFSTAQQAADRILLVAADKHCGTDAETAFDAATQLGLVGTFSRYTFTVDALKFKVTKIDAYKTGKAKICFCDQDKEGTTLLATNGLCTNKENFGADLGVLHVIDVASVPSHTTVRVGATDVFVSVKFLAPTVGVVSSGYTLNANDRFRSVAANEDDCTKLPAEKKDLFKDSISLTTKALLQNAAVAGHYGPQVDISSSVIGKAKLCYCDSVVEGNVCVNNVAENYGAFIGFVHTVHMDEANFHRHVSMAVDNTATRSFQTSFLSLIADGAFNSQNRYSVVLAKNQCGTAEDTTVLGGYSLKTDAALKADYTTDWPTFVISFPAAAVLVPGKLKMCMCHALTEVQGGACGQNNDSLYGSELQFVHVVSTKSVAMHFTLATRNSLADQSIIMEFIGAPATTDRLQIIENGATSACGTSNEATTGVRTPTNTFNLMAVAPVLFPTASPTALQWVDIIGGTDPLKHKVCFCDLSSEAVTACGSTPADKENYGASVGFVHVISLFSLPPVHSTMALAVNQKLTARFADPSDGVYANDRLMVSKASGPCATEADNSLFLYTVDLINSGFTNVKNPDNTVTLSSSADVSPSLVGKLKVCYCDWNIENTSCGQFASYGAEIGFLHLVDLDSVTRHFTVANAVNQALKVTFKSTSVQDTDRFRGVDLLSSCGLTMTAEMKLKDPFTNLAGAYSGAGTAVLTSPAFAGAAETKKRLCFCDASVESSCALDTSYGAEIGTLHVIDTAEQPLHFSVKVSATSSFNVAFKKTAESADGYKFVGADDHCGATGAEVLGTGKSSTVSASIATVTVQTGNVVADYKLCFCDFSVEGTCSPTMETYGATIGFLHNVDVAKFAHITIHKGQPDQKISVTFNNTPNNGGVNQINTVLSVSQCGTASETTVVNGFKDIALDPASTNKLTAVAKLPVAIGEAKLCYCRAAVCTDAASFGAQIATVHVANPLGVVPTSAPKTSANADAATVSLEVTIPDLPVANFGGIVRVMLPTGWRGQVSALTMTVNGNAGQAHTLPGDCTAGNCLEVRLPITTSYLPGTKLQLLLSGLKIPAVGAQSEDAEITLYRLQAGDLGDYDLIETFQKSVIFPAPTAGTDILAASIHVSEATKLATGVTATVTFANPVADAFRVAITFPLGYTLAAGVVTVHDSAGTLIPDVVVTPSGPAVRGKVSWTSTAALAVITHRVTVRGLVNPDKVFVPAQSVIVELLSTDGTVKAVKNNNIYPRKVEDAIVDGAVKLTLDNTVGGTAGVTATVRFAMPALLAVESGTVVRMTIDKAWTFVSPVFSVVKPAGAKATLLPIVTADATVLEFSLQTGEVSWTGDVAVTISGAVVPAPSATQPTTASLQLAFKEPDPFGEVILSQRKDSTGAIPKVTTAILDASLFVGLSSTVAGDAAKALFRFVSPAALAVGDIVKLTLPTAAWQSGTGNVVFKSGMAGAVPWDGKTNIVIEATPAGSASVFKVTLPATAQFDADKELSFELEGVTVPAVGTAAAGGKIEISRADGTVVTYNKQVTLPSVTGPITGTVFALSNTVTQLDATATVQLTINGGIPDLKKGARIAFTFPKGFGTSVAVTVKGPGPAGTVYTPNLTGSTENGVTITVQVPEGVVLLQLQTYSFTFSNIKNGAAQIPPTDAQVAISQDQTNSAGVLTGYAQATITRQLAGVVFPQIYGTIKATAAGELNFYLANSLAGATNSVVRVKASLPLTFALQKGQRVRVGLPTGFQFSGVQIAGGNVAALPGSFTILTDENYPSAEFVVDSTLGAGADFDIQLSGLSNPSSTPTLKGRIRIYDASQTVLLTSTDQVAVPGITAECSLDSVALTTTVVDSTNVKATLSFTSGADVAISTGSRSSVLRLTLPTGWSAAGLSNARFTTPAPSDAFKLTLAKRGDFANKVEFVIQGDSGSLVKGAAYAIELGDGLTIPGETLVGKASSTASLVLETTAVADGFTTILTKNSGAFLKFPQVAAKIPTVTRSLSSTLAGTTAWASFGFRLPAGVTMLAGDAIDLTVPEPWVMSSSCKIALSVKTAAGVAVVTASDATGSGQVRRFTVSAGIQADSELTFTYGNDSVLCYTVPELSKFTTSCAGADCTKLQASIAVAGIRATEIALARGDFLWPEVSARIDTATLTFSAAAIGSKDVAATFTFTNPASAGKQGTTQTKLTQGATIRIKFPANIKLSRNPLVLAWAPAMAATGLTRPVFVEQGADFVEFNIGQQDCYILASAPAEFTVTGLDILDNLKGSDFRLETKRGTEIVAAGTIAAPPVGTGVMFHYGRVDNMISGAAIGAMTLGFKTLTALSENDTITVKACRLAADSASACTNQNSANVFNAAFTQLSNLATVRGNSTPTLGVSVISRTEIQFRVTGAASTMPAGQYEITLLSLPAGSGSSPGSGLIVSNSAGVSEAVYFEIRTTKDNFISRPNSRGFVTGNGEAALGYVTATDALVGKSSGLIALAFTPQTGGATWLEVNSNFGFFSKHTSPKLQTDAFLVSAAGASCSGTGTVTNLGQTVRYSLTGCDLAAGKQVSLVLAPSGLENYAADPSFYSFDVRTSADAACSFDNVNGADLTPPKIAGGETRLGIRTGATAPITTQAVNCDSVSPSTSTNCAYSLAVTTKKDDTDVVTVVSAGSFTTGSALRRLLAASTVTVTGVEPAGCATGVPTSADAVTVTIPAGCAATGTLTVAVSGVTMPADKVTTTVVATSVTTSGATGTTSTSGLLSTDPAPAPPAVTTTFQTAATASTTDASLQTAISAAASQLAGSTAATFTTGTVCVLGAVTTATKVAGADPQFLNVVFTNDKALGKGDKVKIASSHHIFGLNKKVSVQLNAGRFVGCFAKATTLGFNAVEIELQGDGCALASRVETSVRIQDWSTQVGDADGLGANPAAGSVVKFYVTTTQDQGTPAYKDGYSTYGFVASSSLALPLPKITDTSYELQFQIRTPIAGTTDYVRCVAVAQGVVPTLESVLSGAQAPGMLPAPSAILVSDDKLTTIVLSNLNPAATYDSYCAMTNGKVLSEKRGIATVGFAGPLRLADSNTFRADAVDISVIVTGVPGGTNPVNCVAVNAAYPAPLAQAIYDASQTTTDLFAHVGGGFKVIPANVISALTTFQFTGLREASIFDIYCAGKSNDIYYRSSSLRVTTGGFTQHVTAKGSATATKATVTATVSAASELRCVAVGETLDASNNPVKPSTPSRQQVLAGQSADGSCTAFQCSSPPLVNVFPGEPSDITFEALTPKKTYHVFCATATGFSSPKAGTSLAVTTLGSSGIAGDPHVRTSDAQFADFFGESGVYNVFTSAAMQVNARLGLAVRDGSRMLWHPTVMKAGTLLQEVGVAIGETRLRLALHAGGLVSVSDPSIATTFLTAAADRELRVAGVTVRWTKVSETKSFPWGVHAYTQRMELSTEGESVVVQVAESQGYRFLDVDVEASPTTATGLLNVAMANPAELRQQLAQQREVDFLVGGASGDLFAAPAAEAGLPMLA